jgi:hypothetical protein
MVMIMILLLLMTTMTRSQHREQCRGLRCHHVAAHHRNPYYYYYYHYHYYRHPHPHHHHHLGRQHQMPDASSRAMQPVD